MAELEQPEIARYHDHLLQLYREKTAELGKMIVALGGGAFGVSIAYLKEIVGGRPPVQAWMIHCAWWFIASSLLLTLLSIWMSAQSMLKATEQLYPLPEEPQTAGRLGGLPAWLVTVFTPTAIVLLIAGLLLMAAFAIGNLPFGGIK